MIPVPLLILGGTLGAFALLSKKKHSFDSFPNLSSTDRPETQAGDYALKIYEQLRGIEVELLNGADEDEARGQWLYLDSDAVPPPNNERRLTFRFLTLAFRHQIAIADSLDVLTNEDRALSDEELFRVLFKRAADQGLLAKLWDETEKRHADPAPFNPFQISK